MKRRDRGGVSSVAPAPENGAPSWGCIRIPQIGLAPPSDFGLRPWDAASWFRMTQLGLTVRTQWLVNERGGWPRPVDSKSAVVWKAAAPPLCWLLPV